MGATGVLKEVIGQPQEASCRSEGQLLPGRSLRASREPSCSNPSTSRPAERGRTFPVNRMSLGEYRTLIASAASETVDVGGAWDSRGVGSAPLVALDPLVRRACVQRAIELLDRWERRIVEIGWEGRGLGRGLAERQTGVVKRLGRVEGVRQLGRRSRRARGVARRGGRGRGERRHGAIGRDRVGRQPKLGFFARGQPRPLLSGRRNKQSESSDSVPRATPLPQASLPCWTP